MQPIAPDSFSSSSGNALFATLPPGWTTETDVKDGRVFYWHAATGKASWTHPNHEDVAQSRNNNNQSYTTTRGGPRPPSFDYVPAPPAPPPHRGYSSTEENPYMASRRPDNNQCGAIAALVLCPPLGIFALYHSIRVDQCWKAGQYSDAMIHGRQAPQFSSWGITIGIVFWICWFFFRRGRGEWEWPDWRFGD